MKDQTKDYGHSDLDITGDDAPLSDFSRALAIAKKQGRIIETVDAQGRRVFKPAKVN